MTDLATLGLVVNSKDVTKGADDLTRLQRAADNVERSAAKLGNSVDRAGKATRRLSEEGNTASRVWGRFMSVVTIVTTLLAGNAIVNATSAWTDLNSRVNIAVGGMDRGQQVMTRLEQMARRTYSSLNVTAESFLRNSRSLQELGYSTQQSLDFTESLNNALVVSGAKAERAATVQDALSKAMALGELRGDELNTVIQSGGRVAQALAEGLGTTTNKLRGLGAAGKITSDVIFKAMTSQLETLRGEADSMPATIGDAVVLMGNALLAFVGHLDQTTGASGRVAGAIIYVADNIGTFAKVAAVAAIAIGGFLVPALGVGLVGAIGAVTAAMLANPLGLLIGGIALAVAAVYFFGDKIRSVLGDEVIGTIKSWANGAIGLFVGAFDAVTTAWGMLPAAFRDIFGRAMNFAIERVESGVNGITGALRKIPGLGGIGDVDLSGYKFAVGDSDKALGTAVSAAFSGAMQRNYVGAATAALGLSGGGAPPATKPLADLNTHTTPPANDNTTQKDKDAYRDLIKSANDRIEQLMLEQSLVGQVGSATERLRFQQDLLSKASDKGRTVTAAQRAEIAALAAQYGKLVEQLAAAKAIDDLMFDRAQMGRSATEQTVASGVRSAGLDANSATGQMLATQIRLNEQLKIGKGLFTDFIKGFVSDIRQDLADGISLWQAFGNAAMNALSRLADKLLDMALDNAISSLFGSLFGGGLGSGSLGGVGSAATGYVFGGLNAAGGMIRGPGSGTSDSIVARVSNGEFIMNAGATARFRPALEAMNDNKRVPGFAAGGSVDVGPRLAAMGSAGSVNVTFAPSYNVNGSGEEIAALRQQMADDRAAFKSEVIAAVIEGRKRRAI